MNGNTRKQKTVDPDTLPAIVVAESEGAAEYIAKLRRQRAELVKVLEGAEVILAKLDTIRHLDKSFTGLDQLRTVLTKVKQKTETK